MWGWGSPLWSSSCRVLLKVACRGVLQHLIPDMGQLESLLRDGSLTLMNIASLMIPAVLYVSLPTMEKLSTWMPCPEVLPWSYMGEDTLRCSFSLSPKDFSDSPICCTFQSTRVHLNLEFPTYLGDFILVLQSHQEVPDGVASLKMNCARCWCMY